MSEHELTEDERELGTELYVALSRLSRWSARQSLEEYGPGVLSALATVVDAGPVRLGELASRVGVLPASMSRSVATLEHEALVSRSADPADGRSWFVSATPRGRQLVQERRDRRGEQLARHLGPLSPTQSEALRALTHALGRLSAG